MAIHQDLESSITFKDGSLPLRTSQMQLFLRWLINLWIFLMLKLLCVRSI